MRGALSLRMRFCIFGDVMAREETETVGSHGTGRFVNP